MTWKTIFWIVCTLPIWGMFLCVLWLYEIRPRLIPSDRIEAMLDLLLATYGPFAEDEAYSRQVTASYRGDVVANGTWMLIRRRLRRRWERGEVELFDAVEVDDYRAARFAPNGGPRGASMTADPDTGVTGAPATSVRASTP